MKVQTNDYFFKKSLDFCKNRFLIGTGSDRGESSCRKYFLPEFVFKYVVFCLRTWFQLYHSIDTNICPCGPGTILFSSNPNPACSEIRFSSEKQDIMSKKVSGSKP